MIITLFVVVALVFIIAGVAYGDGSLSGGVGFSMLGIVFLLILLGMNYKEGEPITSISAGEYNVLDVYVAGDKVNLILGIKVRNDSDGDEVIEVSRFYEFPVSAFEEGRVNQDGKKLVVIESGSFKRMKLE